MKMQLYNPSSFLITKSDFSLTTQLALLKANYFIKFGPHPLNCHSFERIKLLKL